MLGTKAARSCQHSPGVQQHVAEYILQAQGSKAPQAASTPEGGQIPSKADFLGFSLSQVSILAEVSQQKGKDTGDGHLHCKVP